ncbi:MAG: trypsin-like peptidase domain-containing protein [Planctomycetota bacterium]
MPIRWYGPSLVLLATVITVMLFGPGLARNIVWSHQEAQITQVRQSLLADPNLASLSDSFTQVSEAVEPSVVHIQTFGVTARSGGIFSRFDPPQPTGSGSGWVYQHTPSDGADATNYILTNHHVVDGADRISVRFANGSEHTATLINSDPPTDVAVLEIDDAFLHAAAISPEPIRKGEIVFAFGSPLRFDFSVSQGIVSATGRQLDIINPGKYENFIQTDAAINPGNSGGPLTDIYGRVVGMNTAIASTRPNTVQDQGGFIGLGFAIPVEMVVEVATRIIEDGEVRRGYLGVYIDNLSPEMAATFGFDGTDGVLVEHATGDGPADRGGLRTGDIITHIEGQPVASVEALRYTVAGYDPGHDLRVTVARDAESRSFTVELGELPKTVTRRRQLPAFGFTPRSIYQDETLRALGIERLADFTLDDSRAAGYAPLAGVMVLEVRNNSIAQIQNQVQKQMLITHLGSQRVETFEALRKALRGTDPWQPLRLTLATWDTAAGEFVTRYALLQIQRD